MDEASTALCNRLFRIAAAAPGGGYADEEELLSICGRLSQLHSDAEFLAHLARVQSCMQDWIRGSGWEDRDPAVVALRTTMLECLAVLVVQATRRKQVEQALRLSECRYQTLLDSLDEGYCVVQMLFDDDGKPYDYIFEQVNQAFERQTDIRNAVGRRMREIAPAHEVYWFEMYGRIVTTGKPERFVKAAKALRRWFDVYAFRIGTPEEKRVAILFRDVTDRKQAEDALRESEQRFHHMANNAPFMVWLTEPNVGCTFLSKSWFDFTGQSSNMDLSAEWADVVHPQDRPEVYRDFNMANALQTSFRLEYRLRRRDGEYRWVLNEAAPRFSPEGHFLGHIGSIIDITERRQAEQQQRESEKYLRTIIEQLPAGVGVMDRNGIWTLSNSEMDRYVPKAIPSVLGSRTARWRSWDERGDPVPPEQWPGKRALRGAIVSPGMEMLYTDDDGQESWKRVSAAPLRDTNGEVIGACSVLQDITCLMNAEQALREADRRKDEFLATLAHELRNPLAPIRNGLHLLRTHAIEGDAERDVHDMLGRQVDHMVRLVDDLMEVSRISGGKVELRKEPTELNAVLRNAVETSRPLIDAGHHQLNISFPPESLMVEADPVRIAQVIANLLNNAAKYTKEGGQIWLTAQREAGDAVITVRDNGIGISAEMLEKVFDLFAQAERTYSRSQGGLGIGLTLARTLAEMHGGSVTARSRGTGMGSEFVLRLPLLQHKSPTVVKRAIRPATSLASRRFLVVDDNRDAADSLSMVLKFLGADVLTVSDGPTALAAFSTFRPHVVMLDIGMPGMDGYEVARRARQSAEGADATLIALTGWGQDEDRRRSKDAGIDHHLVKPVNIDALEQLLASVIQGERTSRERLG